MVYQVQVDVIFTGEIYVDAKNEKEAAEIARKKYFTPYDVRNFRFLGVNEVVDVQEDEEDE